MRIFVDARSLLERKPSGISQYARALLDALIGAFPNHTFVLFTNSYKENSSLKKYRTLHNCEVISTRIPNKLLHASFTFFRRPLLQRFCEECDVYFFPNVMYHPKLPKPSVLTVHDISYLHLPQVYSFRNHFWYRMVRARSFIRHASIVVADSDATKMAVEQLFPDCNRVSVVYPAPFRAPRGVNRKDPEHLVVLGDIDERKNVYGILSAYAKVKESDPDYKPLVFIGKRGYVNLRPSTLRLFNELKAKGWIQEYGYVTEKEKWDILSRAEALIFASFYEGFGFPGLEAEMLGVPIIASARTCMPEVFGEGPI